VTSAGTKSSQEAAAEKQAAKKKGATREN